MAVARSEERKDLLYDAQRQVVRAVQDKVPVWPPSGRSRDGEPMARANRSPSAAAPILLMVQAGAADRRERYHSQGVGDHDARALGGEQ